MLLTLPSAGVRLRQHYGQEDARDFLKRVFKHRYKDFDEPQPFPINWLIGFAMTFLCLGAPYAYLRHINEFFMSGEGRTDTIMDRWQTFVDENVADWTNTNLVVSVVLAWPQYVSGLFTLLILTVNSVG